MSAAANGNILVAESLRKEFGGLVAVSDVDFAVPREKVVSLIGPNGAGKTTFIDAISGFVRYRGRVELDGHDLTGAPPHARARRGLARTWHRMPVRRCSPTIQSCT